MWRSSDSPSLGFSGTSGTPAHSAPTTATHVSRLDSAQTAARSAPRRRCSHRGRGLAQLAVAQRAVAHAHGGAIAELVDRPE